jgi:hydrogenase/urease accessory protein HupE
MQAEPDIEKIQAQYTIEYPIDPKAPPKEIGIYQDMLREYAYEPGKPWSVTFVVEIRDLHGEPVLNTLLPLDTPFVFQTNYEEFKKAEAAKNALPPPHAPPTPPVAETKPVVPEVKPEAPPAEPAPKPVTLEDLSSKKHAPSTGLFGQYLKEGVKHIITGYDHLLFVGALILAASTFWELFKVVLAFTLAHSLTLFLASMGWVHLPDWFVEPVIALSIVFVAAENFFFPSHRSGKVRIIVAFGFGLIHGLGYAGGLIDALSEMPSVSFVGSLLAFSIGVELGHQIVILPVFGLLYVLRKKMKEQHFERGLQAGTLLVSAGGVYFLVLSIQEFVFHR